MSMKPTVSARAMAAQTAFRTRSSKLAPLAAVGRTAGLFSAKPVSKARKRVALVVAMAADALQIGLLPAFIEGALSPFEDALDATVALVLVLTLGFEWRLALAFALELVPGATLFPTWSAAVLSLPVREEDPTRDVIPPMTTSAPLPWVREGRAR
ncbi:MAG: hypothetical protein U0414_04520 [Polyangiaceae bacterium]